MAGELGIQAAYRTRTFGSSFEPSVHADTVVTFDGSGIREEGPARSRLNLVEPALLARMALAVGAYQLIFETGLHLGNATDVSYLLLVLGGGALGGGATWLLSGLLLRAVARRSPTVALYLSWGLLLCMLAGFVIWAAWRG